MQFMICVFGQETNTFAPGGIGFDALAPNGWIAADTLISRFRGTRSYLGGAIRAADRLGAGILPFDSIYITGGAQMTDECLETCADHICTQIQAVWEQADGLYIGMHGAGSTEKHPDMESYVLTRIREIVGERYPIVSSLDIHANITPEMVALSSGLFPIKENPHVDMDDAADLAVTTMFRTLRGEISPVMTFFPLPILLPNTTIATIVEPMKSVREYVASYCKAHGLLDATLVQGFSAGDQYWAGASVLITAERPADREAAALAAYFWNRRQEFNPHSLSADEAMEKAAAYTGDGYVIINESTDNPGSGCPGDGTHLLREMVRCNLPGSVFMYLYDPVTAEQAHAAGVDSRIDVRLGGRTAAICGAPLALSGVQVVSLSNGEFTYVTPQNQGVKSTFGKTARLRYQNVEIVVASVRDQAFDDRALLVTGGDINQYRIVGIKSANHFRAYFQSRAALILPCETPGLRPTDLRTYPYKKVRRPIYPIDDITELTP